MSNWLESLKEGANREAKTHAATFRKLKDGSWGALIKGSDLDVCRCDALIINKSNGEVKQAMVGNVVASFDDAVLVSIY